MDELRAAFYTGSVYAAEASLTISSDEMARIRYPYPSKPERTVTLSKGHVYRIKKGRCEYKSLIGTEWFNANINADDVRLLASLLEEK